MKRQPILAGGHRPLIGRTLLNVNVNNLNKGEEFRSYQLVTYDAISFLVSR